MMNTRARLVCEAKRYGVRTSAIWPDCLVNLNYKTASSSRRKEVAAVVGLFQLVAITLYPMRVALAIRGHAGGRRPCPLDNDVFARGRLDGCIGRQAYGGEDIVDEKHVDEQESRAVIFGVYEFEEFFIGKRRGESK